MSTGRCPPGSGGGGGGGGRRVFFFFGGVGVVPPGALLESSAEQSHFSHVSCSPTAPVRGKESLPVISIEILVPLVSPAGCGRMAPCAPTGSGRLSRGLLLLWGKCTAGWLWPWGGGSVLRAGPTRGRRPSFGAVSAPESCSEQDAALRWPSPASYRGAAFGCWGAPPPRAQTLGVGGGWRGPGCDRGGREA